MATTAIDTLRYARRLKEAGVPSEQAEAMSEAIASELVDRLATKQDLEAATTGLKGNIEAANTGLRGDMEAATMGLRGDMEAATMGLRGDMEAAVARLEGSIRLLQWMMGFTLAFVVAIAWRVFG